MKRVPWFCDSEGSNMWKRMAVTRAPPYFSRFKWKRGPADPGRAPPGPVLWRSILKARILTLCKLVTLQQKTRTNAGGEGAASHGPRVLLLFAHIYQHSRRARHPAHCFPRVNRHRILPGRYPGSPVWYTGKHRLQGNGNNSPRHTTRKWWNVNLNGLQGPCSWPSSWTCRVAGTFTWLCF